MAQEEKNPGQSAGQQEEGSSIDQSILLAAICYGIVPPVAVACSILMLVMKKSDDFVIFHAKQGLVFGICGLIAMMIPLANIVLAYVGFPIVAILAMTYVFKKEFWKMPIVADLVTMVGI